MRIALLGSNGQLGQDLRTALTWLDDLAAPMPHEEQPSGFHH